jgi:transposase
VLGELVQTTACKWITHPPTRCPNGHVLGPGAVLVGHQACLGHGGGHTTWTCRTCDETTFGVAPVPVWSDNTAGRVCLTRSGNRQLNAALHRIAVTQIRLDGLGRRLPQTTRRRRLHIGGIAQPQTPPGPGGLPQPPRRSPSPQPALPTGSSLT